MCDSVMGFKVIQFACTSSNLRHGQYRGTHCLFILSTHPWFQEPLINLTTDVLIEHIIQCANNPVLLMSFLLRTKLRDSPSPSAKKTQPLGIMRDCPSANGAVLLK